MGKTRTNSAMYALLLMLLVHIAGFVAAVDIIFYDKDCFGGGWGCLDVNPGTCCLPEFDKGYTVSVKAGTDPVITNFYRGGGCTDHVDSSLSSLCLIGGSFTGAGWIGSRRRSLLADDSDTYETPNTCDTQMNATAFVYSQESTKGYWILETDGSAEMHAQMVNIPDVQKVDWLQAQGATFRTTS